MRPASVLPLATALLLTACAGEKFGFAGQRIYEYVPLDGERWWEYVPCQPGDDGNDFYTGNPCPAEGETVPTLRADKLSATRMKGRTEVVTIEYGIEEPAQPLFAIEWSSDSRDGVQIHGLTDLETGAATPFNPPILVSEPEATADEVFETTTAGITFTSTYASITPECPKRWNTPDEWECLGFTIDDGGASGAPFVGSFWFAQSYGTIALQPAGEEVAWVLNSAEWAPVAEE